MLPKSSLLAAEFAGGWEGSLEVSDRNLRVALQLSKATDGTATGVIDSPDLGAALTVSTHRLLRDETLVSASDLVDTRHKELHSGHYRYADAGIHDDQPAAYAS